TQSTSARHTTHTCADPFACLSAALALVLGSDRISCDVCKAKPIVGVRFKCVQCSGDNSFDVCEGCEAKHDPSHNLLKIKHSQFGPRRQNRPVVHKDITCDACNTSPLVGIRFKCTVRNPSTEPLAPAMAEPDD